MAFVAQLPMQHYIFDGLQVSCAPHKQLELSLGHDPSAASTIIVQSLTMFCRREREEKRERRKGHIKSSCPQRIVPKSSSQTRSPTSNSTTFLLRYLKIELQVRSLPCSPCSIINRLRDQYLPQCNSAHSQLWPASLVAPFRPPLWTNVAWAKAMPRSITTTPAPQAPALLSPWATVDAWRTKSAETRFTSKRRARRAMEVHLWSGAPGQTAAARTTARKRRLPRGAGTWRAMLRPLLSASSSRVAVPTTARYHDWIVTTRVY